MAVYKEKLLRALADSGWEQVQIDIESSEWWIDEQWEIRSIHQNWGLSVYLTFLVDPQWEGVRKKGQGIWQVMASSKVPRTWLEAESQIAVLSMSKGYFDPKLETFMSEMNRFRNSIEQG